LRSDYSAKSINREAESAFNDGDGEAALDLLAKNNLAESSLARRIRGVLQHRQAADTAIEEADFEAAKRALEMILDAASPNDNQYAKAAQKDLDDLAQMRTRTAQKLMAEAAQAERERNFVLARENYQRVLVLDPDSRADALAKLAEMRRTAQVDYNLAMRDRKTNPERARKLLHEVMDRLVPTDHFYRLAEIALIGLEAQDSGDEEAPNDQDEPADQDAAEE